jgi:type IV secretion system protein VirB10
LSAGGFGVTSNPTAVNGSNPNSGFMQTAMPAGQTGQQQQQGEDPNKQDRKDQFARAARNNVDPSYSPSQKIKPRSEFEVKAGAIIPAVMIGGINSDLPGQVIAQVRENVYDSKTGQHLLIPQGSRLIGLYDAHVAYGQQRILLAWNRVIYPDGSSFDLKGMPGADKAGYAGFFDKVDNHYAKIFGSAVLMSFISAGVQLSQPAAGSSTTNSQPSVSQTVGAALGQQIGQTAMTITQKNLNIQPTLEVRPGYQFNVMVTADMILPPV